MQSEYLENKVKIIFIACIAFFVLLLLVITYFIYFEEETSVSEQDNELSNLSNMDMALRNQERVTKTKTKSKKLPKYERTEFNEPSDLLNNIKDDSYKRNDKVKQVFNISNNVFTYDDAKAVCKAYNSDLATYEQVVDAYKRGGEWCNYGWSQNQMALYPTQKKTWDKLQEDPVNANICGEWGVNGGYFENPNTLFGANCYGKKPEPKDRERVRTIEPSEKERNIIENVKRFKAEIDSLNVAPFNKDLWSQRK